MRPRPRKLDPRKRRKNSIVTRQRTVTDSVLNQPTVDVSHVTIASIMRRKHTTTGLHITWLDMRPKIIAMSVKVTMSEMSIMVIEYTYHIMSDLLKENDSLQQMIWAPRQYRVFFYVDNQTTIS